MSAEASQHVTDVLQISYNTVCCRVQYYSVACTRVGLSCSRARQLEFNSGPIKRRNGRVLRLTIILLILS